MTHLDLEENNNEDSIKMNIPFNNIFSIEINDLVVDLLSIKMFALNVEFNWLEEANKSVLNELMSWKNK